MRRRLYFLLPDVTVANRVEKELLLAHIDDHHMHFLSSRNTDLGTLPKANVLQKSDILHAMFLGLIAGGITGALLGTVLYFQPEITAHFGLAPVLLLAIVGAVFGSWASGMIGISTPNCQLKSFHKKIEQGWILLMVDVPKDRVKEISAMIRKNHPGIHRQGIEAHLPAFP